MREQIFSQRHLSNLTAGPSSAEVPIVIDKITRRIQASPSEAHKAVVLVSCGSFNPPTNMHLRLFELAKDDLLEKGFDVLGGYMSPVNDAYGKKGLASSAHRIRMCQAAADASDIIMVDPWEASQPEYQRSLHVLQSISQRVSTAITLQTALEGLSASSQGLVRTMLLCGSDLVESFLKPGVWKSGHIKSILEEHGVICISRNSPNLQSAVKESNELQQFHDKFVWVEEPVVNEISSSKIRDLIQKGKSAKFLTPDPVLQYIKEHGLYSS